MVPLSFAQTLLGFLLAMSITVVLMPLLMRWAGPLHFLDLPDSRKVHAVPVPRVGGIAMDVGILSALLLWGISTRALRTLPVSILILLCFGMWDDRRALDAGPKFLGQLLAVGVAVLWGGVSIATMTLSDRIVLAPWIALPLTFLFLLGGTNAFNLADGLDGLAGGMAMLCLSGIGLLAFTEGDAAVGGAAVIMLGALLGFLRFNTHPARVFMGDSGSQVLGFSAAVLAILLTQNPQSPFSSALPLLLLGIPIVDTLLVMTERLLCLQSPFKADRRHIHHRLLALGFRHWEAVSLLYLLQGALFVAAWFLRYSSDLTVILSFVAVLLTVPMVIRTAQLCRWQLRPLERAARVADRGDPGAAPLRLTRAAARLWLGLTLAAYAAWVLLLGVRPTRDVSVLALMLGLALGWGLVVRRRREEVGTLDKIALYCSAALAIFLSKQALPAWGRPALVEWLFFPAMLIALAVCIRSVKDREFRFTPLDILVLLLVVTIPNLPDSIASTRSLGISVAELVLLFYGLEALIFTTGRQWRWLTGAAAVFLLALAARGFA